MADNVKVAVRVRPFNGREKDLKCFNIISMDGPTTTIKQPETSTSMCSALAIRGHVAVVPGRMRYGPYVSAH